MTTAPLAAAQFPRAGAPARQQAAPTRQRLSTAVLVLGTALSLGSLFGPDWVMRFGVAIAVAAAVISCALAWRELYSTNRKHAQDLLAVGRRHTADLRAERQHNAEVLDTVSDRARRWRREVDRQQAQIAGLRVEATALGADLASVRRQLIRADGVIAGLRETVRERDIEIALLRSTAPDSYTELHLMPRRMRVERATATTSEGAPTRRLPDLHAETPALPNFEADRRPA